MSRAELKARLLDIFTRSKDKRDLFSAERQLKLTQGSGI
jgi:hypothetical protein